MLITMTLWSNY